MLDPSDDELDRLLSRGQLGQEHKQRLLRNIMGSVAPAAAPSRRFRWRWPAFATLSLSGALAVAALLVRPSAPPRSELRDKGTSAGTPILAVACLGGSLNACPAGARIAFWVEGGPKQPGFVTAYADPAGGGERVWYLTNEAVPKAALVGKEQSSGRYHVTAILTTHPVVRSELAHLAPDALVTRASFDLLVSR